MDLLLFLRPDFPDFPALLSGSGPPRLLSVFPRSGVLFSSPFLQLFSPRRPLLLSLAASPSLPALWGSPPVPPLLRALHPRLPTPSGPSLLSPSDLPRPLLLWAQLRRSLQRGLQAKGAQDWGRVPPFLCPPESRLEARHSPRQRCLPALPRSRQPSSLGPQGQGSGGRLPRRSGEAHLPCPW